MTRATEWRKKSDASFISHHLRETRQPAHRHKPIMLARSIRSHYVITYLPPQIKAQFAYESQSGFKKKGHRCGASLIGGSFFGGGCMHGYIRPMRAAPCVTTLNLEDDKYRMWVVNLFLDVETFPKVFSGTSSEYHRRWATCSFMSNWTVSGNTMGQGNIRQRGGNTDEGLHPCSSTLGAYVT